MERFDADITVFSIVIDRAVFLRNHYLNVSTGTRVTSDDLAPSPTLNVVLHGRRVYMCAMLEIIPIGSKTARCLDFAVISL